MRLVKAAGAAALLGGLLFVGARSLQRARNSANEALAVQDVRAVFNAQSEYAVLNGGRFGTLECLAGSAPCAAATPRGRPGLLKAELASTAPRRGYRRHFELSADGEEFQYWAIPEEPGRTGGRAFCADADFMAFREPSEARVAGPKCGSLRGAFDGVHGDAERRREARKRLRAGERGPR